MNVVIIGCGARGSLVAGLLTSAGVEELSLVDGALVEESDLGAHPLQYTPDLNAVKSEALVAKLGLINSKIFAQPFPAYLDASNASAITLGADVVVDCAGDPDATSAAESACADSGTPFVPAPADFTPDVDVALAAAVAAEQAAAVLAIKREI